MESAGIDKELRLHIHKEPKRQGKEEVTMAEMNNENEGIDMDASVVCPHCGEIILSVDEDGYFDGDSVSSCEHLVYLWIDSGGGFEMNNSKELRDWLTDQKEANGDFDESDVLCNAERNPFVDTIIEHHDTLTGYYGFKKA